MKFYQIIVISLFYVVVFITTNIFANDDHLQCIAAITFYEKQYDLPPNLLHAIAITESGKWNLQEKMILPWPWTLNVMGKGYYFETQQQALQYLRKLLSEGIEQIDIGCAQVNWLHHGKHHFQTPENALNPIINTAYAAYFLTQNYQITKNWRHAVARYHSKNSIIGEKYAQKVSDIFKKKQFFSLKTLEIPSKTPALRKIYSEKRNTQNHTNTIDQMQGIIVYQKKNIHRNTAFLQ